MKVSEQLLLKEFEDELSDLILNKLDIVSPKAIKQWFEDTQLAEFILKEKTLHEIIKLTAREKAR